MENIKPGDYIELIMNSAWGVPKGAICRVVSENSHASDQWVLENIYISNTQNHGENYFYVVKNSCKPSTIEAYELQNKNRSEFIKGEYIVCLRPKNQDSSMIKYGYIFKQLVTKSILYAEKDIVGNATLTSTIPYSKGDYWRYATQEEIVEYDRIGGPYDVGNFTKSSELDEWLKKTKAMNLSLDLLKEHIGSRKTPYDTVFIRLSGQGSLKKAQILYDEWNPKVASSANDLPEPKSKFDIGDIVDTDTSGYEYTDMNKYHHFEWKVVTNCNIRTNAHSRLKVLNKNYSAVQHMWWYNVEGCCNWITEDCMSLSKVETPVEYGTRIHDEIFQKAVKIAPLTLKDIKADQYYYAEYKEGDFAIIKANKNGSLAGAGAYSTIKLYSTYNGWSCKNNIRLATPNEIAWLDACINAGKYVPKPDLEYVRYNDNGTKVNDDFLQVSLVDQMKSHQDIYNNLMSELDYIQIIDHLNLLKPTHDNNIDRFSALPHQSPLILKSTKSKNKLIVI